MSFIHTGAGGGAGTDEAEAEAEKTTVCSESLTTWRNRDASAAFRPLAGPLGAVHEAVSQCGNPCGTLQLL